MQLTTALAIWLAPCGSGQLNGPTGQELSAFEQFAIQSTARVIRSTEIGRVEALGSTAVVNAIAVRSSSDGRSMRGVRIDFTGPDNMDRVFVGEPFLKPIISVLFEIERNGPAFFNRRAGQSSCFGSGLLLRALREGAHSIYPSWCEMNDGFSGLSLSTGHSTFRFAHIEPHRFIALLDRAVSDLERR
jgi:hypothetical protein